jgi:hypothetical protein
MTYRQYSDILILSMMNIENHWWLTKPATTKNIADLTRTYNDKYGDRPIETNERFFDNTFNKKFKEIIDSFEFNDALVVGANDGVEIDFLKNKNKNAAITAIDVSDIALNKLKKSFPDVETIHGDIESTTLPKNYDLYICCRTIHSSNIDIEHALQQAIEISNNLVISVSNAYIEDGKLIHGMFDYKKNSIDKCLPYSIQERIVTFLREEDFDITLDVCSSELFIIAKK